MAKTQWLFALSLLVGGFGESQAAAKPANTDGAQTPAVVLDTVLEEVVVVGRRPGPPLWKVQRDGRVLWLFGLQSPLPRTLEWDDEAVEYIVSESSHYLPPPQISASLSNPFKIFSAVRRLKKAEKLPKGQTLKDVLDPDLLARLEASKAQFAPRKNSIYKLRPLFAAEALVERAFESVGLRDSEKLVKQLEKLVNRYDLEALTSVSEVPIKDAFGIVEHVELPVEVACLDESLATIEVDLKGALARAAAWAEGDASLIYAADYPAPDATCTKALLTSDLAIKVTVATDAKWLDNAAWLLGNIDSAFGYLPMEDIVRPDGLLAALAGRGYDVSGQQGVP